MRKKKNLRTIRCGLCVLAGLACSIIFGGGRSHAANKNYEKDFLKTYDFVAKATPTTKPGTWESVNDPQGSGSVKSSDKYYYQSARYRFTDGTYANNQWVYAYDEHGAGPYWYFIGPDGFRTYGWQFVNNKGWYLGQTQGKWNETWDYSHEENTIKGVDVSVWQEYVDWKAFKDAGYDFAFIRAGYGYGNYHDQLDSYFRQNMKNANAAGIAVGVYYYSTARSQTQAVTDARFLIEKMQGYTVSYPVVIDLEDDATQGDLSKDRLTEITRAFCEEIKKAGYTPMIYVNENWYTNHLDMSKLQDIDVWLATYGSHHSYSIEPAIWQCGSTAIRPDGKNNESGSRIDYVDINFGYKDYRKIITPRTNHVASYSLEEPSWHKDSGGWWLYLPNGTIARHCFKTVNGKTYYFDGEGYALTGNQTINDKEYFFKNDCSMACDEWIDGKYYGADGVYDPDHPIGTWIKSGNRWWYKHYDGSYTKDNWELINDKWYFFDKDGWMITGWLKRNGIWYYLDANGELTTGWFIDNGIYYYSNERGQMVVNCFIDDKYYVGKNGAYTAYKNELGTVYLGKWYTKDGKWRYLHKDGTEPSDRWELIKDKWYFFDAEGYMVTGWLKRNGIWYYLDPNGALLTGWYLVDGTYYYSNERGQMAVNRFIDDKFYVGKNGAYTAYKNELGTVYLGKWYTKDGKWRYLHKDGTEPSDRWELIKDKWYFFDSDGYMVTGWLKWYYNWYYFDDLGALVTGWFEADGNWYYANEKGHMLRDTYVDGYYINKSGIRVDNEQPTKQSVEQSEKQSVEQSEKQPVEQSAKQPVEQSAEQSAEQPVEQSAEQPVEQPIEQSTE